MTTTFAPRDPVRFEAAIKRFDEENSHDPNRVPYEGRDWPRELLYAHWLTDWVLRLRPEASEELRLAARCQHLCRWMVPRDSFPRTRAGYLRWREELKKFHAQKSGTILREVGYAEESVARVQALNLKKGFPQDPETRVMEDALCLVFLERQFTELADKLTEEKMLEALRKAWAKMSDKGRAAAGTVALGERERELVRKALEESQ